MAITESRSNVNTIKGGNFLPYTDSGENTEKSNKKRDDYGCPVKLIYKPYIARRLIHSHNLVDIVPDSNDPDRTVFVFEDSLKLRDDMLRIIKNKEHDNNEHFTDKYEGDRKVIINPCIARRLINRRHKVVDIEANRENAKRTVFVFADNLDLRDDMSRVIYRNNTYSNQEESE